MTRPRLLDLYCGAGGAGMGYSLAGFDVVGVDVVRHVHYPFPMVRADALDVLAGRVPMVDPTTFDAIHASPPCQVYSVTRHVHKRAHPDLLAPTRDALRAAGKPYVIENVPGAPMPGALTLCGSEFGLAAVDHDGRELRLRRHRLFESSVFLMGAGGCMCLEDRAKGRIAGVYANGPIDERGTEWRGGYTPRSDVRATLLGIDWMNRDELSQAIPPAYTRFIGEQVLAALPTEVAA